MRGAFAVLLVASTALLAGARSGGAQGPPSATAPRHLARAHAHNDYEQPRPLHGAIEHGFASIEVDVVLRGDVLYVAHDEGAVDASRTLRSLYLDPLRELVRRRGGWLYAERGVPLQLLIDVKSEAVTTYEALDATLARYDDLFTAWTPDAVRRGPVTAVISGNRALAAILADTRRFASIDGRLDDDRSGPSLADMPLVSVDWETSGASTTEARVAWAAGVVTRVQREGRRVRFWGVPDTPEMWAALARLGVDYIGTDDSAGFTEWLTQ